MLVMAEASVCGVREEGMSADLLRKCAAKMRENAEAATPGTWEPFHSAVEVGSFSVGVDGGAVVADPVVPVDAVHIASWHPDVALAAAKWLEMTADHMDPELALDGGCSDCEADGAMEFARAYLGDDA